MNNDNKKSVPKQYHKNFTDDVDGYLMVYNPLSDKGMSVLNKEATQLYRLIDGKRNIEEICSLLIKDDPNCTFKAIQTLLYSMERAEIIYFDKQIISSFRLSKQPPRLVVWLHITNQCNLRCTYCYVNKTNEKMNPDTAKKTIDVIISSAKKHNIQTIVIKFAGGEPVLELAHVISLIHYAKNLAQKNAISIHFVVISNGVLLTEKVCRIIKENTIRLGISFDGLSNFHDRTRVFANGLGSFAYVEKGIEIVQKYEIPFNVIITISSQNVENIPEFTEYLLKKKVPFVYSFVREKNCPDKDLENSNTLLITQLIKSYQKITENIPTKKLINGLLDRVNFERPHLNTCGVGNNYLVVRHDGKILSCQMEQDRVIGSIDDEDIIETMKKGNFIQPVGLTVEGKIPCKSCKWKYVCCGGCPLLTYQQKGMYSSNTPYCDVYKKLIPHVLKLEARRLIKYKLHDTY
ncbi:MAG: radical SAM protein [Candidatus Roizmanbacteria bacterium]